MNNSGECDTYPCGSKSRNKKKDAWRAAGRQIRMTTLNEIIAQKTKIHTRDIKLATYPHSSRSVIIHGILKDERYVPVFDVTGEVKHPGVIHHLDVKLLVRADPLAIEAAEAEMLTVPMPECRTTLDAVPQLTGLEIKPGFTAGIRNLMGGNKGCTHLCHLVTVMGQEIVHGWLTQKRRNAAPLPKDIESLSESSFLIDSCRMWKKDGPKMERLIDAIVTQARPD